MLSPRPLLLLALALVVPLSAPPRPITIWLAGDSTMAEKASEKRPETGWGEMLGQYFSASDVVVANRPMNGRSSKSFITEGRWAAIVDSLAMGDYVFIQFGHNDESKDKGEPYSTPEEFTATLTRMVADARGCGGAAGAARGHAASEYRDPVQLRCRFVREAVSPTREGRARQLPDGVKDNTHFRPLGAELMARSALDAIRELRLGLTTHLRTLSL